MVPSAHEIRTHGHVHPEPSRNNRNEIDLEAGPRPVKTKAMTKMEKRRAERERKFFCKKHSAFHACDDERERENTNGPTTNRMLDDVREGSMGNVSTKAAMDVDVEADIGLSQPFQDIDTAATFADDESLSDSSQTEVHEDGIDFDKHISEDFPEGKYGLTEEHNNHTHWSVIRSKYREPLAELLAVTVSPFVGKDSRHLKCIN